MGFFFPFFLSFVFFGGGGGGGKALMTYPAGVPRFCLAPDPTLGFRSPDLSILGEEPCPYFFLWAALRIFSEYLGIVLAPCSLLSFSQPPSFSDQVLNSPGSHSRTFSVLSRGFLPRCPWLDAWLSVALFFRGLSPSLVAVVSPQVPLLVWRR